MNNKIGIKQQTCLTRVPYIGYSLATLAHDDPKKLEKMAWRYDKNKDRRDRAIAALVAVWYTYKVAHKARMYITVINSEGFKETTDIAETQYYFSIHKTASKLEALCFNLKYAIITKYYKLINIKP